MNSEVDWKEAFRTHLRLLIRPGIKWKINWSGAFYCISYGEEIWEGEDQFYWVNLSDEICSLSLDGVVSRVDATASLLGGLRKVQGKHCFEISQGSRQMGSQWVTTDGVRMSGTPEEYQTTFGWGRLDNIDPGFRVTNQVTRQKLLVICQSRWNPNPSVSGKFHECPRFKYICDKKNCRHPPYFLDCSFPSQGFFPVGLPQGVYVVSGKVRDGVIHLAVIRDTGEVGIAVPE